MPERLLNGIPFAFTSTVACQRDASGRVAVETPARTYGNPKNLPLSTYGRGPFARLSLPTDEPRPGVFAIVIDDRLAYIGKASASLAASFGPLGFGQIEPRACFEARDAARCRVNGEITQALTRGARVDVYFHATAHAADLERSLVATLAPSWNDAPAGRVSPAAMHPSVANAIRELHLVGLGAPEIAARLHIREAFASRIVEKMDRRRHDFANAG